MATRSRLTTGWGLVLTALFVTAVGLSPPQPADHLVPPPPPAGSLPVAQRLTHAGFSEPQQPEGGFMTRVARWFGLGGAPSAARDQQLAASSQSYAYPKPVQNFDAAGKPCGLCNKYPWVPMFGQQQPQQVPQQHISAWQQQHQQQQQQQPPLAQATQQRQRAVQFQAPPQSVFLPISLPVPGLSNAALPPLYNAQPFRPLPQQQQHRQLQPQSQPQQPLYHAENVGAHSELRPVPVVPSTSPPPTPPPRQSSSNFEIVQSHQLTDFITSVEYPATYVQSHAIDLGQTAAATATSLPRSHRPIQQLPQQSQQELQQPQLDISTVRYQLEDLSSGAVHQHLPASQLLTELGHFTASTVEAQTTLQPPADNYPAASSQQQQQHEEEQEQQQAYYAEQYQELVETSTMTPLYEAAAYTTEPPTAPTAVELNNHLVSQVQDARQRQRETPKRLLDSPINHGQAGAPPPRPFTRDPAELNFRLGQPTQPPTPTSTYGAIDASGQYAGMSPPGPQQVIIPYTTKQKPRPFEPSNWTPGWRLHRPTQENDVRELHEQQESKLATATAAPPPNTRRTTKYLTKILATNLRELLKRERETKARPGHIGVDISKLQHNIDGWTEQEYNSLSHRPSTPTIRGRSKHIPTEYLTTTTPATPTATSTALRQAKTTHGAGAGGFELGGSATSSVNANGGDLSTSINNLEQLHLRRFRPVEDNRLLPDYYESQHRHSSSPRSTTPMPTATPTTTTTPASTVVPLYVRSTAATPAPMELWKQAKVAILPQTNEKVYVVTPQPRHKAADQAVAASVPAPVYQTPAPRFPNVRPTPGAATVNNELMAATPTPSSEQLHNYTPDIFGLMGLSAYVPAEPVEIIDGNSKVITIVTTSPAAAALQRPTPKSTISPRPR